MIYCEEASNKDVIQKRPIATATVGTVCLLDVLLSTGMDPGDISATVTWNGAEVEK